MVALSALRRFYPKHFDIVAITVDMGFPDADFSPIAKLCEKHSVPFIVTKTEIAKIVSDYRKLQPVITNGRYVCLSQPNNGGFSINAYYTDKEIFVTAVKVARNEREDNNQTLFFQLPFADENAVYNERYSGEKFLGNRLKEGLPLEIGVQEKYYKMFHFYRG